MKRVWLLVGGIVVLIGVGGLLVWHHMPKPPIPQHIQSQLTSSLLLPKAATAAIDRPSVKYDANTKLLTFKALYKGHSLIVSEQPTPEQFVDIPAAYDKLVDSLNPYTSFDTAVGTVHLARSKEIGNHQVAVMNSKGTLMFVRSNQDMTDDEWRQFFNSISLQS